MKIDEEICCRLSNIKWFSNCGNTLDNQFYNELSEDLETKLETVVKRIIQT